MKEYKYLNELNQDLGRIKERARRYMKDSSIIMEEKIKIFEQFGKHESYIWEPKNKSLNAIAEMYMALGYVNKHETIKTTRVIDWWIDQLQYERTRIITETSLYGSRSRKLVKTKRNHEPSAYSLRKLRHYYYRLLIEEGTSSFEFDW